MNEWVVTFKLERQDPVGITVLITEFYRGNKEECLRIRKHFNGVGSDDRRAPGPYRPGENDRWKIITGPAEEWDEFLR